MINRKARFAAALLLAPLFVACAERPEEPATGAQPNQPAAEAPTRQRIVEPDGTTTHLDLSTCVTTSRTVTNGFLVGSSSTSVGFNERCGDVQVVLAGLRSPNPITQARAAGAAHRMIPALREAGEELVADMLERARDSTSNTTVMLGRRPQAPLSGTCTDGVRHIRDNVSGRLIAVDLLGCAPRAPADNSASAAAAIAPAVAAP